MIQLSTVVAQSSGSNPILGLLPLVLMVGVFYFLLIRPQQRRARAQQALIASVDEGDEIVTTSGIIGTVVAIDDDEDILTVEVAPGTNIRILRAGVGRRLVDDDEVVEDEAYEDGDQDEDSEDEDHGAAGGQQGPIQQL